MASSLRLLLSCCVLVTSFYSEANERIVHLGVGEWPPYISEHLEHYGPLAQLVHDAFKAEGVDVDYHWLPWTRALKKTQKSQLSATFPWYKSPKRMQHFYYSAPLMKEAYSFIYRKDSPFDWQSVKDLSQYHIGANTDYYYNEDFALGEKNQELTITRVDSEKQLVNMLLLKRVDAIIIGKQVGRSYLKSLDVHSQLIAHHKGFAEKELYVLFPKLDPLSKSRRDTFNRGLLRIQQQGKHLSFNNTAAETPKTAP